MPHVLVVGLSTRAAAASAARAGFQVTALDAFGDLDQHSGVRSLSLPRNFGVRFTAAAAARVARTIDSDAVVYLSSFENSPRAVNALSSDRTLWGNSASTLQEVRNPARLAQALGDCGFSTPALRLNDPKGPNDWLVKPIRSGGGHRIRHWHGGDPVPRGCYLQEFVPGTSRSVVFIAARGCAVPLGVTRQLIGDAAFGARGFQYCGNILDCLWPGPQNRTRPTVGGIQQPSARRAGPALCPSTIAQGTPSRVEGWTRLATAVSERFGLVGINGIDFIERDGVPYVIEVNPRWSASVELVERSYGLSAFQMHAGACCSGELPPFDLREAPARVGAVGKAVVFARRRVEIRDTRSWLGDSSIGDVPHPGERIGPGRPICTVFAEADDEAACYVALARRANEVYGELATWESRVA